MASSGMIEDYKVQIGAKNIVFGYKRFILLMDIFFQRMNKIYRYLAKIEAVRSTSQDTCHVTRFGLCCMV